VGDGQKHILFAMLHEGGHLNPSFKLARALAARGHRVSYLAIPEAESLLGAQGFATLPLYPDLYPRGFVARDQELSTLARRRAITRRYRAMLARLAEQPASLLAERPDLMLVDVTQPQLAFWARRQKQPFLYLNTSLPQTHDRGVPPPRSARPHATGLAGTLRAELEWARFLAKRRASGAAAGLLGMGPPYELARLLAARFDVPARELDWHTGYMPQLRGVPELMFCPAAFDYPRPPAPHRHSVASVDLERREAAFDFGAMAGDKPLVYCALGGQRYRPDAVPGFFARLIQALRDAPHTHLLLSLGKHAAASSLGELPGNVTVVESAPQLAVLRRARLMITHAGLGSVKECIVHGVPMLAVPLDVDQPANAARIVYHGLGARADVATSSAAELGATIRSLLTDPQLKQRVDAMRARFLEVEQGSRGVELVEAALR
jgi:zeaxanthin glucosyltransferase